MKPTTLLLLLLFSISCLGQPNDTSSRNFKRVQIGISFSPDYCYRSLFSNYDDGHGTYAIIIRNRDDLETAKFGYHAGFDVCININKWLGLQTGLQFSKKGFKTKFIDLVSLEPEPNLPTQAKTVYSYCYMGIPVKVNFIIGHSKVRFIATLGEETELFVAQIQKSVFKYADGSTGHHTDVTSSSINRISLSLMAGAGIDCKLNNRMNLRIEPVFRYGVLKITKGPISGHFWDGGLMMGYYVGL